MNLKSTEPPDKGGFSVFPVSADGSACFAAGSLSSDTGFLFSAGKTWVGDDLIHGPLLVGGWPNRAFSFMFQIMRHFFSKAILRLWKTFYTCGISTPVENPV